MINMSVSQKILKRSLLIGAIYFFLVSAAHMFNIKVPMLFIYFNMPSYAYQDKIISFLAFGWAMFLYAGFRSVNKNIMEPVKYILFAGAVGIVNLSIVNISTDFNNFSKDIKPFIFWVETFFLSGYLILLTVLYYSAKKVIKSEKGGVL